MNRFREPIEVGLGWFPSAQFSRSRVDLRGNLGKALGAVQVEIGSLGKVPTDVLLGSEILFVCGYAEREPSESARQYPPELTVLVCLVSVLSHVWEQLDRRCFIRQRFVGVVLVFRLCEWPFWAHQDGHVVVGVFNPPGA